MLKRKLVNKYIFIVLLIVNIFSQKTFAKIGEDHSWDMLAVIGLYSENDFSVSYVNKQKLDYLFASINSYIDKYNQDNFYNNLKAEFPYFNWGEYGHRLINHWGFDIDIDLDSEGTPSDRQYPEALKSTFQEKFEYYYGNETTFLISDWNRFLKYIRDTQKERNFQIINSIKTNLGIRANDSRDIGAILYYTHLLGDHVEHEGNLTGLSVLEIDKILLNINLHIKNLSKQNKGIYTLYKNAINSIRQTNETDYAEEILNYMKIYIPKIIKQNFSTQFANKGLIFCFEEEILKVS